MTDNGSPRELHPARRRASRGWRPLLGASLLLAGVVVLVDVSIVALFSAWVVAGVVIVTGGIELLHGLTGRGWSRWGRVALGLLYVAFGLAFARNEMLRTAVLIFVLGFSLLVSGGVRLLMGLRLAQARWLSVSGIVGLAAGLSVLAGWPDSSARTMAFALALDLIAHGLGWLFIDRRPPGAADPA